MITIVKIDFNIFWPIRVVKDCSLFTSSNLELTEIFNTFLHISSH